MTETAHVFVASAIALKFPDPAISVPLAFTSHFIMDAVPHWDFGTDWRARPKFATGMLAIIEMLIGITVTYFIFGGKIPLTTFALTLVAALLPDCLEAPWYIFFAQPQKHRPSQEAGLWEHLAYRVYKAENFFHHKTELPLGVLTQIATVIFFFILLK